MGYFANLYLIEASTDQDSIRLETAVYGDEVGERATFSWIPGLREGPLFSFASDTIFCDKPLKLLPTYPVTTISDDPDRLTLDASFSPRHNDDPVVFHFRLPEDYVARADLHPLIQPVDPCVIVHEKFMTVTYPVSGAAKVSFEARPLQPGQSLADYDEQRILRPGKEFLGIKGFEIGAPGIFKAIFG
jgi:hypothetical protein